MRGSPSCIPHVVRETRRGARWLVALAWLTTACAGEDHSAHLAAPFAPDVSPDARGVERVSTPESAPRVLTALTDRVAPAPPTGAPTVTVGCASCHSLPELSRPNRPIADLPSAFHQGLVVDHGARADLRCDSCHAGPDYAHLRTADGRQLPFTEVNTLCRQCHGPQARDFDHGAHGGMQGHWDLAFGDRLRHSCTTCHDPHAPKYAAMWPARPPGDVRWKGDRPKTPPPSQPH